MNDITRTLTFREKASYGLFWSWNLIFVAFMVFGFAPRMLPELLSSVKSGLIPVVFLVDAVILSLVPVAAVILGLTLLRRAPLRQFALGYVVEGPLMLLLVVRFFVIRQATPAVTAMMVIAGLGMTAFLWHVLDPAVERRGPWLNLFRLAGLTLMLLTSLYAAVWIAFYAAPALAEFFKWLWGVIVHPLQFARDVLEFLATVFRDQFWWIPFTLLGLALGIYTLSLLVLTPVAVPLLSIRTWLRSWTWQVKAQGKGIPTVMALAVVALTTGLFVTANRQPQKQAFALLQTPPADTSQALDLMKKQDSIRAGLLNAYLSTFRYISAVGEVWHVNDLYRTSFNLPDAASRKVQAAYEVVARPLLYEPVTAQSGQAALDNSIRQRESDQAARLYQSFFDTPIVEGERKEIERAVTSTWSGDRAEEAWRAADDREVHLAEQEISITEHGDWAEVELYEVYENRTANNQEVIYYFSLPESAAITGLWLGNSPDRAERYAFQVSPRGAAQAVYRNETRVQRDPALLEQIGPRQYRLRAFPVLPRTVQYDSINGKWKTLDAPSLYLWVTYRVVAEGGTWPMPRLAFKNNIYWDAETQRRVNGAGVAVAEEAWLPESVPLFSPSQPAAHRIDFPGGVSVVARPAGEVVMPDLPTGARLALVIDRSLSMQRHEAEVSQAVARLRVVSPGADVYLTSSPFRGEAPSLTSLADLDSEPVVYFGGQNPADLLAQFDSLQDGQAYDAVLVLTDGSAYELGAGGVEIEPPQAPVWMIHLGGEVPLGYADQTLEAIQASGGGVTGSLDEALERLAVDLAGQFAGAEMSDVLDGYTWTVLPTVEAATGPLSVEASAPGDGFFSLLARRLVMAEIRKQRGTISELDTLDQLHGLAKEYGIVTPYSSMIVLVNERQEDLLAAVEKADDRFEREYEGLNNTTPLVGVPEPEEWVLIIMSALVLAWYVIRNRTARTGESA